MVAAGALALSLPAMLAYYESRGADWERQMLLRARVCAGDAPLGATVLRSVQPSSFHAVSGARPEILCAKSTSDSSNGKATSAIVKHMRGGIRHIDLPCKALQ
jgi:glutamate-ammonia-ligase adenylyltransferase